MNIENDSTQPGSQVSARSDNDGTASTVRNKNLAPQFSTAIGYALWDIHHGKYPDRLVPHAEAAEIARIKPATLTTMRSRKTGPPFVRIFGTPYYDLADLIHWIEKKMEFSRV